MDNNNQENLQDNVINDLISEYTNCRLSIKKMITDLEELTQKLILLFPDHIDNRYRHLFEEKIRTVTDLYKALLDLRKEYSKSIKDEIELHKKMKNEDENDEELGVDIATLANKLQIAFEKNKEKNEMLIEKVSKTN